MNCGGRASETYGLGLFIFHRPAAVPLPYHRPFSHLFWKCLLGSTIISFHNTRFSSAYSSVGDFMALPFAVGVSSALFGLHDPPPSSSPRPSFPIPFLGKDGFLLI